MNKHYCQNPLGKAKKAEGLHCSTLLIIKNGQTICPKCNVPYEQRGMYERYLVELGNPHNLFSNEPMRLNRIDLGLREAIGKTDDIRVPVCSHVAIINRELGENFCRICQKDLSKINGRYNDYLVLRHPQCFQPICFNCAETHPDEFHLAYRRGLILYKKQKELYTQVTEKLDRLNKNCKELISKTECGGDGK